MSNKTKRNFQKLKLWIKDSFLKKSKYDINALASQLAYFLVVAFFTTIGTVVTIASFIPAVLEQVEFFLMPLLPQVIGDIVREMFLGINTSDKIVVLISTIGTTFWFASRCFFVAIRAVNEIYHQERLLTFKARLISFICVLGLIMLVVVMAVILLLSQAVMNFITSNFDYVIRQRLVVIVQYLITTSLLFIIFWLLYYFLPSVKINKREALPGTIFTTIVWIGLIFFFSIYVNNFNSFSWILGGLGGIFLFLIWIYWSCIIFLNGVRINYFFFKRNRTF